MAAEVKIDALISRTAGLRGGRPCIAGTGVSVQRIATWHNGGLIPEEIVCKIDHINLAQIHAALAYYYSNKSEIDEYIAAEACEEAQLSEQSRR